MSTENKHEESRTAPGKVVAPVSHTSSIGRSPANSDGPGFEYELPENVDEPDQAAQDIPRFQDFQHPYAKLFVTTIAILTFVVLIYQAYTNLIYQHANIFCTLSNVDIECSEITIVQVIEFVTRVLFEVVVPLSLIVTFLVTRVAFATIPSLVVMMRDPTRILVPVVSIIIAYYFLWCFLTSLTLLPHLATTTIHNIWIEYFKNSVLGIFWIYGLINMQIFSKLCVYNQYRLKEKYEQLQRAQIDNVDII